MAAATWLLIAALVAPSETPLTVSAAVSLTDALTEIGAAYEKAGGTAVRFNFAPSNVLARQIVNGAPVDVFISADQAQMDVVERARLIEPGTRVELVSNALALLVRRGVAVQVREARDLTNPGIRRIAIGNPEAVPAGVYARQWLTAAGLWSDIQKKIVPVGSARAALAAVESGSVDSAVVYQSDTAHLKSASLAFVAATGGPRIAYPAAILKRAAVRDKADSFLGFAGSEIGQMIFIKHKFLRVVR
jgi:molybdate transport system substrate-binding protein